MNNIKAEPWMDYSQERSEDRILALRDDRPRGIVPGGNRVAGLTAGIDTQDDGFWYEIRAWGWGGKDSWQVREGFILNFDDLEKVLWNDIYKDSESKEYLVQFAVQDAMGHRTADVYDFCRRHRGRILPFQGVDRLSAPFVYTTIEHYPGSRRPIPGGIRLVRANVTYYKNRLANFLDIAPGDPGNWAFHAETTEEWAGHMVAEYRDEKELWQCPPGKANHGWDCSVCNLVAADIIGIQYWSEPGDKKEAALIEKTESGFIPRERIPMGRRRPEWFNQRRR